MKRKHAEQIAALLNSRNQLTKQYTADIVMDHSGNYVYRIIEEQVVACVEVKPVQWYQAEIRHLTVHSTFEGKGHAKQLLSDALDRAKTDGARVVQCTIREGNAPSENLFKSFGFTCVSRFRNKMSGNNVGVWQKVLEPAL